MQPRLFIETTIPSYLTARPARDIVIAGQQQVTREWWEFERSKFDLYTSQLVIDEASAGHSEAAERRLACLSEIPRLDLIPDVADLANRILEQGSLPRKASDDAAHIATASVHGLDLLLTWNCRHIANAVIQRDLRQIVSNFGYRMPDIVTPLQLMEFPS